MGIRDTFHDRVEQRRSISNVADEPPREQSMDLAALYEQALAQAEELGRTQSHYASSRAFEFIVTQFPKEGSSCLWVAREQMKIAQEEIAKWLERGLQRPRLSRSDRVSTLEFLIKCYIGLENRSRAEVYVDQLSKLNPDLAICFKTEISHLS